MRDVKETTALLWSWEVSGQLGYHEQVQPLRQHSSYLITDLHWCQSKYFQVPMGLTYSEYSKNFYSAYNPLHLPFFAEELIFWGEREPQKHIKIESGCLWKTEYIFLNSFKLKISQSLTVDVSKQIPLPACLHGSVWSPALHRSNPVNFTYTCISSPLSANTASACTWLHHVSLEVEEPKYNLMSFAVQLQSAEIIHCWLCF